MTTHPTWQNALSNAITRTQDLCVLLNLAVNQLDLTEAERSFSLRVPREFVARMEKGNPNDPLLLQVLPQFIEMQKFSGFSSDPVGDLAKNPVPGLLHKYHGRVLLTLTGGCAINCRYCFRRHFPYAENSPGRENYASALNYIRDNNSIEEVIFSGGDPLLLKDNLIAELVTQLETIPHLKRLRIHTRLPIVIPQRVTDEWIQWMRKSRFQKIIVLHCNHPNEIDEAVFAAIKKLRDEDITLLNQSVLLRNINDNAETLINLSKKLFEAGVLPYYLHLLDKVDGSAHFDVSAEKAKQLMVDIKEKLPGFLVPKLAREIPGMMHKDF
ncbi:MAG: EF-P beta-lysylation protein EpmB [Gammaproteobacteria bacterium]|nr:EF-P beta-lysylation protein EpmB [Gammaproteobacteria bacterium]